MYDAAIEILLLLYYVFLGYCLQYFFGSFLEGRIKDKRLNGFAAAALYAAFLLILYQLGQPEAWDQQPAVWKLALSLLVLCIIAFCFYKSFRPITVFLLVTFQAAADISRYTAVILFGKIGDGMLDLLYMSVENGLIRSEKTFGVLIHCVLIGGWILEYAAMGLLVYFSLKKIVGGFREKEYSINGTELLFILTPSAVGLMICMLLRIIMISAEDGVPKLLYDKYPALVAVIPLILLLSLFSVLCGVKLFQDMICRNREKSGRIILEKQIAAMREHMEETERVYSDIRRVKHDMKNTLSVITRLSDLNGGEENAEIRDYLAELNSNLESSESLFKTGNTVADTMLNMKYHEGKRCVPDLKIDAEGLIFPRGLKILSYDIGVILGNALDNAVEACVKLKDKEPEAETFIKLYSVQKGDVLILSIENSFDGKLTLTGELPATDKKDKSAHGMGLYNIRSTAEKYRGTMDFKVNGRVFVLSVMMKNERSNEDELGSNG